jgi:hypothetical protein
MKPGQTFLIPSGPKEGHHLFFVTLGPLTLPQHGPQPHFALAGVTTIHSGVPHDDTCLLRPGDHSFIQHDSYIFYQKMRLEPAAHIERLKSKNVWIAREDCSPELLQRIVAGIFTSKMTPRHIKDSLQPLRPW